MISKAAHSSDQKPKVPFWKDERLRLTHITSATAVRLVLIAVAIAVVVFGVLIWRVFVIGEENKQLVQQVQDSQKQGRAQRLEFEKEIQAQQNYTNAQVRNLACSVVAFVPPNQSNDFIRALAKAYNCPPYKAGGVSTFTLPPQVPGQPVPNSGTGGSGGGAGSSTAPGPAGNAQGGGVQQGGSRPSAGPTPSSAPSGAPSPSNTPTSTPRPTQSPTSASSKPLVSVSLCIGQLLCVG